MRNSIGGSPKKNSAKDASLEDSKANEDLINFLEHKLEEIEKKLAASQSDYEALQNDYMELQEKMNLSREKHKRAALLLTDFLDDLLNDNPKTPKPLSDTFYDSVINIGFIRTRTTDSAARTSRLVIVVIFSLSYACRACGDAWTGADLLLAGVEWVAVPDTGRI